MLYIEENKIRVKWINLQGNTPTWHAIYEQTLERVKVEASGNICTLKIEYLYLIYRLIWEKVKVEAGIKMVCTFERD